MPLGAIEPADGEDEVVVALGPIRKLLRRVRHHIGVQADGTLQAVGDVA